MVTVLLNVIFGIIIDTFSELRSDSLRMLQDMQNTCFICRIDRFTLDTKVGKHLQLTAHYSLPTTHSSLPTTYLLMTIYYSLLTTECVLLTAEYVLIATCRRLPPTSYLLLLSL